jgi:hypothetical protein
MGNVNIELAGYSGEVVEAMIHLGFAKTKTEAIRLALFQFDQLHKLTEEEVFEGLAAKIAGAVDLGKMKTRKFNIRELD